MPPEKPVAASEASEHPSSPLSKRLSRRKLLGATFAGAALGAATFVEGVHQAENSAERSDSLSDDTTRIYQDLSSPAQSFRANEEVTSLNQKIADGERSAFTSMRIGIDVLLLGGAYLGQKLLRRRNEHSSTTELTQLKQRATIFHFPPSGS